MRIGIVGTFDVANFGDLLFPLLAANELGERLGPHELVPYSYHDLGPDGWAYEVRSLGRLFHDLPELDLLLVGGGDLVRFDKGVAPGYGPADPTVHHPTGYWLSPTLLAASCGVPVAWNAVGVVPGAPEWAQEILRLAVGSVDYLTVRDEQSARELTRAAPSTHIRIVPDTAFGVRRLVPESPTEAFRRLRERAGLGKGYVVLQASHELLPYSAQIEQALAVARRAGLAIVELPASPALGDRAGLFRADAAVVRLDEWPHPLLFAEIIGGAEAVIAKSLHVSIVALAFGVPVHRPRGASDPKHAPLEALQGMSFWEAGDDGGARLQAALGQGEPGPDARQRAVELSAHWDAVAALAGTRRAPRAGVVAQLTTGATSVLDAAMAQAERRPTLSEQELELLQTERMSGAAEARSHLELERLRRECTELRAAQTALRGELAQRQALLDLMLCSASWRVTAPLRRIRVGLAAARAAARRAAGGLARRGASAVGEPASSLFDSTTLRYTPLVSVLMPVHDTEPILLRATVESVRRQTYPHWELCICDDGSTRTGTVATLRELAADDDRIRLSVSEENRGVSAASNRALAVASGELAALLDHDDELAPDALLECIRVFGDHPETQVVYTDEDKLDEHGRHCESFFKPDWSPELFRGVMYVGHLLVARRELVEDIGGFDPEFDSIQDYELMLRLSERTDRIRHIPKVLYHWRKLEGSLAASLDAKPGITELQARAVNAHLERCGLPGEASPHPVLGHRVVIRPRDRREWPSVSIVIPSKDAADLLGPCLESVRRISTYPALEVIVVDGGSSDPEAREIARAHADRVVSFEEPFNFSAACNAGVRAATGTHVVLLNNDIVVVTPDWLEILVWHAELPGVGVVGPLLVYPDGSVQHAGIILGPRGTADHVMRGFPGESDGYAGSLSCTREVSAVTGACMLVRRTLYGELGGMSEHFSTQYQDVDFCLRLRRLGYRILFTPRARLVHREGASRGDYYDLMDRALLLDVWGETIARGDPYYNPNLDVQAADYRVAA